MERIKKLADFLNVEYTEDQIKLLTRGVHFVQEPTKPPWILQPSDGTVYDTSNNFFYIYFDSLFFFYKG